MANTSFVTTAAYLKERYAGSKSTIPDLTYPKSFLYATITKDKNWGGKSSEHPLVYGHNQSGSANFGTSQSNNGQAKAVRWSIPTSGNKKHYWTARFPTDVIRAMESQEGSYVKHVTFETDSVFESAARRLSIELYRDGWGAIGTIGSVAGAVVTLTNASDARNFEPDAFCQCAQTKDSGVMRDTGTQRQILSIDEDAGTVTFTTDVAAAGWAANDTIFYSGDRQNVVSPVRLKVNGLEILNPYSAAAVTTLYNVDRSMHRTRLGGHRLDGSAMSLHEGIQKLVATMCDRGGQVQWGTMSFANWNELANELGSARVYEDVEQGGVGFGSIVIRGPGGKTLKLIPDNAAPANRVRLFTDRAVKLLSLGEPIGFLDEDDIGPILRLGTEDAYETRIGGYLEAMSWAPLDLGVLSTDGA